MATRTRTVISVLVVAGVLAAFLISLRAQGARVGIDADDIGGVVTSASGPEAGVWVIAETTDLPTKFAKIVVTDDQGRYVLPDLPKAEYSVWVRGYGLVDSTKVRAAPGRLLNLNATTASSARAAAEYYPANYWYSLLHIPAKGEFPGTGEKGNGISEQIKSQAEWMALVKTTTCETCHQLGNKATREIPKSLGTFKTSVEAWERRLESGQGGAGNYRRLGRRALELYADWTDRIAAGELPPVPPRPQGAERNVVITEWEYGDGKTYLHDGVSTYKPNPTVNPYGLFVAAPEASSDFLYALDPKNHVASKVAIPVRDPNNPPPFVTPQKVTKPSPYWGEELVFTGRTFNHSAMWDSKGRVWSNPGIRPRDANPAWCKQGSSHPSAKAFPIDRSDRQIAMYDPRSKEWTLIDSCFSTHHVFWGEGPYADWLFFNTAHNTDPTLGWLDVKKYEQTKDEQQSQGWTTFILDTNGNGKRDAYVEPGAPIDPTRDARIQASLYGYIQSPVDYSIWGGFWDAPFPGAIVRTTLGSNPPETTLSEIFYAPWGDSKSPVQGSTPRGLDVDRNGVVWTNLSGSGHIASFDRRKCKGPLNGPTATGAHCPEGWTVHPLPGPHFKGISESGNADAQYTLWVDQFDTFGMGKNVPIVTGSGSDSLQAFDPATGRVVVLRVPYPMGFYSKGVDGRIDDPKGGWKGKGLWSTPGHRTPAHVEGGKGTPPRVYQFQLRPNPLAK